MHDRDCFWFSTLASGRRDGKTCANFSRAGKKLRIQTGIDTAARNAAIAAARSDLLAQAANKSLTPSVVSAVDQQLGLLATDPALGVSPP
jgi:hypothetical protein